MAVLGVAAGRRSEVAGGPRRGEALATAQRPRGKTGVHARGGEGRGAARAEPAAPDPAASDEEARRERAAFTLASYLDWARYPPASRPARERPDRYNPHSAPVRELPLAGEDGRTGSLRVVLWQSHVYLAGPERATLTVACRKEGRPAACAVRSATIAPEAATPGFEAGSVAFADDGAGPDAAAGDGVSSAAVAPGEVGFAGFTGPLRVSLEIEAEGERGAATFVLVYTSGPPATFTGTVTERLAGGSLWLCVGMRVREPGRYVLDARVDDAAGETFAFVSFDGVLAEGEQEGCFQVFGRLVRDEAAAAPFTLRDVEGYLLLEDVYPDRHTVPTWEGEAHTTRAYALDDFSDVAWESEAKARHVAALGGAAAAD